jgi:hypothetical protein
VADRNRLESGRWRKRQPRVRIPPPLLMPTTSTTYRLDRRFALQLFGWRMVLAGVLAIATFVSFGVGGFGRTLGTAFLALAVLLVATALWTMVRPPLVVVLTTQGFRLGRPAGGKRAHWMAVENVNTDQGPAGTRLVFTLDSGQTCDVPLMLLPRRATELQREVHERLNTAHGYRRLN